MLPSSALIVESPPSPVIPRNHEFEPSYASVPLSWVPPNTFPSGLFGSTDRLSNCSVLSPAFTVVRFFGMLFRSCWQFAKSCAVSNERQNALQSLLLFLYLPSERMTPPSEPTNHWFGSA